MNEASLEGLPVRSRSVAVDGTDIETWGALHGSLEMEDIDAADLAAVDLDVPKKPARAKRPTKRRARVLGIGPDGRRIYTADPDARGGHRSATASRDAGTFVGYELHNIVQVRDVKSSDGREVVTFGPDVPPVITDFVLTPAGSRRDDAIVPALVAAHERDPGIRDVLMDRGYSQLSADRVMHPLRQAGMDITFQPKGPHQRKAKPFSSDAVVIDGQLFSAHMPKQLWAELPWPPYGANEEEAVAYERPFNERARWRYQRLTRPATDGTTRWQSPFGAGLLRSRQLPSTMRGSRNAPLVELPDGVTSGGGTMSVTAAELPFLQKLPAGTTAWRKSYRRRNVVEGVNGMLKGSFVSIQHKFLRVFTQTKVAVLLTFTVAGYNVECIRSFKAGVAAAAAAGPKHTRAKRRRGTWGDILGGGATASGRDPPPG